MSYTAGNLRLEGGAGLYAENSGTSTESIGGRNWIYRSADVKSAVAVTGYFSDAVNLGLLVGDVIKVCDTTTPMVSLHRVTAVTATATTISSGLNIT